MELILANDGSFYTKMQGFAEGTAFWAIYKDDNDRNFLEDIKTLLSDFEKSLSVYDPHSVISRINNNQETLADHYLTEILKEAKAISDLTQGAFDISAEPLFQLWGFSSGKKKDASPAQIEAVMQHIGMDKIRIEDHHIVKTHPSVSLNANAIAKGYSADLVANFLEAKGITAYLVEIGGEIRLKGKNPEGTDWSIGIDKPIEERLRVGEVLQTTIKLTDCAIATSGNYRQFYVENGKKISHTIDPRTGYPTKHNLLSATVIAQRAITADAFATAFLVAGLQQSIEWVNQYPFLEAVLIYNEQGEFKTWSSL